MLHFCDSFRKFRRTDSQLHCLRIYSCNRRIPAPEQISAVGVPFPRSHQAKASSLPTRSYDQIFFQQKASSKRLAMSHYVRWNTDTRTTTAVLPHGSECQVFAISSLRGPPFHGRTLARRPVCQQIKTSFRHFFIRQRSTLLNKTAACIADPRQIKCSLNLTIFPISPCSAINTISDIWHNSVLRSKKYLTDLFWMLLPLQDRYAIPVFRTFTLATADSKCLSDLLLSLYNPHLSPSGKIAWCRSLSMPLPYLRF